MFDPITIRIAGTSFGEHAKNIKKWGWPDVGWFALFREPENPHDPNAIRISFLSRYHLGYVPKTVANEIAPLMDGGRNFLAEFVSRNEYAPYKNVGLTVRIVEAT